MQGTRAIEKMRGFGAIERGVPIGQSVAFDLELFQAIICDINECTATEAYYVFCWLLRIGIDAREQREYLVSELTDLHNKESRSLNQAVEFIQSVSDPQFVEIAVAHLMHPFLNKLFGTVKLNGLEGAKTSANSQSKSPGDFWFETNEGKIIGVEVKDHSKRIGFDVLYAISARKENNPSMAYYFAVTAAKGTLSSVVEDDPAWQQNINHLRERNGIEVYYFNIADLKQLYTLSGGNDASLFKSLNNSLAQAKSLKVDTIKKWKDAVISLP
jgi:hypothetical protein